MKAMREGSPKQRVMLIVPSLSGGGEERIAVYLANKLNRERFDVILALGARRGTYLNEVLPDVEVCEIGAERARGAIPGIVRVVRAARPQVVISFLGFNLAVAMARPLFPRRTRVIGREGSFPTAFLGEVHARSRLTAAIYRQAYQTLYRVPNMMICQCDAMVEDLADNFGVPRHRLRRIYNPVDMARVRELAAKETDALYEGVGPHLVSVGRLAASKAFDVMLLAFKGVRVRYANATLTIIGDGDESASLNALCRELELTSSVRFIPFQANPFRYMRQADLFVSSSLYEGLALVMLESLACGTPIVATDCPSCIREVIRQDFNGWLAAPQSVEALTHAIIHACGSLQKLDKMAISEDCAARFSVEHAVSAHEKLIVEVNENRRRNTLAA